MLLSEEVEIGLGVANMFHYENLGYIIPRIEKKGIKRLPHGTKIKVKVEDLQDNSTAKVNAKCDCPECKNPYKNVIWQEYIRITKKHDGAYFCKECAFRLFAKEKINETKLLNGKTFYDWCIEHNRLDVLTRWDNKLNNKKPKEILYGSGEKIWFKCPKELHPSELKNINHFTSGKQGSIDCNVCNSIAQWGIDNVCYDFLEKYWSKKNKINPWKINFGSQQKIWIICQNENKPYHEDYDISCANFIKNKRCPYCSGHKVHKYDSLGYLYPQVFDIWSEKNKKSPYEYTPFSEQKVWWKCLNGHDSYYRSIGSSNRSEFRCPECVQERTESILQEKTRLYLESLNKGNYRILHEYNCTLNPRNIIIAPNNIDKSRGGGLLRYDNEIILNNKHLFIEVMGQQHDTEENLYHKQHSDIYNTTLKEELEYQVAKDKYKEQYVYDQGENYYYLAIWYYDFDKNDTYKKLIDDKIIQILNNEGV